MNLLQIEAVVITLAMLGLFMWERWRYDVVAMAALLAAVLTGVVRHDKAFEGFAHPVIVIIASVLIVSRAIARSRILDTGIRALLRRTPTTTLQVGALATVVAFLSALIKNVGTLGIFLPVAIQTARRNGRSPSLFLMPMSFASLIGGTMTLVGTSPNILISTIRAEEGGSPFRMFDFLWVGLPLTCMALVFLAFGWRLLPQDRQGRRSEEEQFDLGRYMTELQVPDGSAAIGRSVGYVEDREDGDLIVTAIVRGEARHPIPSRAWRLRAGDVLIVRSSPDVVKAMIAQEGLELTARRQIEGAGETPDDMATVEAIVAADSPLIGESAESLRLRRRYEVNLLAVSQRAEGTRERLHAHRFREGDVALFQGFEKALHTTLADLKCLPLADRNLELGRSERGSISLVVLGVAIALILSGAVNVEIGFFGAAVVVIAMNQITLKNAYAAVDGPVIVMLGCLLPIGEALRDVGVTHLVAAQLTGVATHLPAVLALGFVLLVSMLVTPVMHHAPAVVVMGPIAADLARSLGYNADAFLMAVALGAACDFLSPIGHQNNLLVKEPGGYRFGDYWKLGLPLSLIVLLAGAPLIAWTWPLR